VAEVGARALRAEQLTSALIPLTPSFGSIFRNSFPVDLFVKIVFTKDRFEKNTTQDCWMLFHVLMMDQLAVM
jgi:hypothetical protein